MTATAVEGVILAVSALGSVVAAWVGIRNAGHIQRTADRVQEVHVLVNNRLDAALEKIARLQDQIKDSNGHPTT